MMPATYSLIFLLTLTHISCFSPDYKEALRLSILFYEAQRSGKLPQNNRISWRGDSALNDRGLKGEDLVGGYYDASDYVKFSFTMAFTSTILAWGMIAFPEGYKQANEYQHGLDAIKWATDYFIKCHVSRFELYGQIGNFSLDHTFWGRPEDMHLPRPAFKIDEDHPGTELASEVSAAFASASVLFKTHNETYSKELKRHAIELYEFASVYRGLYQNSIPGAKEYYESTGYGEELTWASIWLYKATKNVNYVHEAEHYYRKFRLKGRPNEFFYHKKVVGIQLLLAEETAREEYKKSLKNFCDFSIKDQTRTPNGLIYIDKIGTLSHASNIAFICLQAFISLNMSQSYINFAKEQIDYILGSKTQSYVIGYGQNYPKQPHHGASSCPPYPELCTWKHFSTKNPNPHILNGALVSGPDQNDHYEDNREEFAYNEVSLDYNAGFQSSLAGLIYHKL